MSGSKGSRLAQKKRAEVSIGMRGRGLVAKKIRTRKFQRAGAVPGRDGKAAKHHYMLRREHGEGAVYWDKESRRCWGDRDGVLEEQEVTKKKKGRRRHTNVGPGDWVFRGTVFLSER